MKLIKYSFLSIIIILYLYYGWIVPYQKDPNKYISFFKEATNQHDYDRALNILEHNIDNKLTFDHFYYYGIAYQNLKEYEKAEANFKRAIALDSSKIDPYLRIARINYAEIEDFTLAKSFLEKATNIDSLSVDLLIERGAFYQKSGKQSDSKNFFKRAVEIDSGYVFGLFNLGVFYLRSNQLDSAEIFLFKALKKNVDPFIFDEIYEHIGVLYFINNDLSEAKKYFKLSYDLVLRNENVNFHLGILNAKDGNHNEAINHFNKTIQYNNSDFKAYFNRAISLFELERFYESIEDLDRACAINPSIAEMYGLRGNAKFIINDDVGACSDFKRAKELGLEKYSKVIIENC